MAKAIHLTHVWTGNDGKANLISLSDHLKITLFQNFLQRNIGIAGMRGKETVVKASHEKTLRTHHYLVIDAR